MRNKKASRTGSEPAREPFTTLDDLKELAQALTDGLEKLSAYRHPLEIRRGVGKEVSRNVDKTEASRTVKAGSKTYFFDIKKTREGKPYLIITESRFKGEGQDRERSTVVVFPEEAEEFAGAVKEMVAQLG